MLYEVITAAGSQQRYRQGKYYCVLVHDLLFTSNKKGRENFAAFFAVMVCLLRHKFGSYNFV